MVNGERFRKEEDQEENENNHDPHSYIQRQRPEQSLSKNIYQHSHYQRAEKQNEETGTKRTE